MNPRNTSLALLVATTFVVAGCSSSDRPKPPPMATNAPPAVAAIANVTANQDTVVGPIEFAIGDDTTPANQITVTAAVDGGTPFPADNVQLAGTGATRSITLKPLESTTGTANVTVTAIDAQGLRATRAFSVVVNARNASVRDAVLTTFAKNESDDATALNGFTFAQDADDPTTFDGLLGNP
jgi:hypothetical protein